MVGLEALQMRLDSVDRDRETAEPILLLRGDEVGEAHVRPPGALAHLLAEHRKPDALVIDDDDVIALAPRRP